MFTKKIELSDHFDFKKLLRFTLPSIVMMLFSSVYIIVDGFFISNFVGKTAFASVNIIMPFIMILASVGFMFGSGGSALVSLLLGENKKEMANRVFSLLTYVLITFGIVASIIGFIFVRPIASMLGATEDMMPLIIPYARISMLSLPFFMLQNYFQSLLVTAARPGLGLLITIIAGINNMVFDGIFVGLLKWGVVGAATATVMSEIICGGIPLLYFAFNKKANIHFTKPIYDFSYLLKTCSNGISEFLSTVSFAIVSIFFHKQLLRYIGENGVSAYGVIIYLTTIFISIFIGYSMGVAPVISYHFGAKNTFELKSLYKKSLTIIFIIGGIIVAFAQIFAPNLVKIFVGYDANLEMLTLKAFRIIASIYLVAGLNFFASAYFTALNDGKTSAILSFMRGLFLQIFLVLVLPIFFGVDTIWYTFVITELVTLSMAFVFFKKKNKHIFNK